MKIKSISYSIVICLKLLRIFLTELFDLIFFSRSFQSLSAILRDLIENSIPQRQQKFQFLYKLNKPKTLSNFVKNLHSTIRTQL